VAVLAFAVLQKTLHLPALKREVRVDYLGALLITGGVSVLLVWVSLAGTAFAWVSWTTAWLTGLGLLLLVAAVVTELRVPEPIIPMHLFGDRTTSLATFASAMVGVAMFGSTVFLAQYFQVARGMTPTSAGLMSLPLVVGLFLSSIVTGRLITAYGRWKAYLVGGMLLVIAGTGLLGTIDHTTALAVVGAYMALLGIGLGAVMQNLVVAVQNNTAQRDMGAVSAVVAFFRTLGGAVGVSALGAVLGHKVSDNVLAGLARLGVDPGAAGDSHAVPDLSSLPGPLREVFQAAFGDATGQIFAVAVPFAVLALVAVLFIREVPLRTSVADVGSDAEVSTAGA
jgi:hypothetical protein